MLTDILGKVIEHIVIRHPDRFKAALLRKDPGMFVQTLGKWQNQSWANFRLEGEPESFEDLVTLFTVGKFNRSLVRLDLDEAALLFKAVHAIAPSRGVEIGRGWGGSTMLLAVAVGHGGRVTSVELYPNHDEDLQSVLTQTGLNDRVNMLVGDSRKVSVSEKSIDWTFIDGGHNYELARDDHNRWGQLVRSGGYIIHHDATMTRPNASGCPELLQLRDEVVGRQAGVVERWREAGSLIVFRRTSAAWKSV